jgi:hypothetical protein
MVPLEKVLEQPGSGREEFVPPEPRRQPAAAPEAPPPRRFRVVDVMTGRVLAEDAGASAALAALRQVERLVDVHVYVWQPGAQRWRLLTLAEQKAMWARRPGPTPARPT